MSTATTWEQSVEKARLASLKTFEGRLEIARSSFEQIPGSKGGRPKAGAPTLADFAEEVGIQYSVLTDYRSFAAWWGNVPPQGNVSYSFAREAMAAGKWKKGADLVAFTLREDPPLYESDEFEPYQFKNWTVDALRVYLGNAPTNTGKLALKERAGEKIGKDDLVVAGAKDDLDSVKAAAGEVADYHDSREILNATHEAEEAVAEEHHENVHEQLVVMGPDGDEEERRKLMEEMQDAFAALGLGIAVRRLVDALDALEPWMKKWGHIVRHEGNATEGELMDTRLNRHKADIDAAFERALGIDSIEEGFARLLASS